MIRKYLLSLLLIGLLAGCAGKTNSCPEFPIPNAHVVQTLDDLGEADREVWAWLNQLVDLCQQLGTCEEEE